jgi:ketosteroid isomerase-like protein
MPTEADIASVRRLYDALATQDMTSVEACFHPDTVWSLPGNSVLAGTHRGWSAIRDDIFARQGPLSGGTFRARLLDLAVGDAYIVAIVHATATYAGRSLDQRVCQLIRVEDGMIREIHGHYADVAQLDAFWGKDVGPAPE